MTAWKELKTLDLEFNEIGKDNLDKIIKNMTTEEIEGVISDMDAALQKARETNEMWKDGLNLALAIAKQALKLAV